MCLEGREKIPKLRSYVVDQIKLRGIVNEKVQK